MMRVSNILAGVLLAALALSGGCASVPYTGRSQFITLSEDSEMRLGLNAARQRLATENIETGTAGAARVEKIGRAIAAVSGKPQLNWQFHTVVSEDLNAYCLPGGAVFFHTALLDLFGENDAETAAVMGHEIAHALARHGAERYSQSTLAEVGTLVGAAAVAISTGSSSAGNVAGMGMSAVAKYGVLQPYSRLHESEADHIGVMLMAEAGYDPRASLSAWEKMIAANAGRPKPPTFLSTHPSDHERLENLRKLMPEALKHYTPLADH